MHVLFDHQTFSIQAYGGISRYFDRLISGINATSFNQASLAVQWSDNIYIHRQAPFANWQFKGRRRLLYALNRQVSQQALRRGNFDLLHATYYDPYFLTYLRRQPFVITIHDMIHERLHPQFAELQPDRYVTGKHLLAQRATAIITVSEFTRHDVISLLSVDPARVHVVHHGCSLPLPTTGQLPSINRPYLLFVGSRGHYKNFAGLLRAFALVRDHPDLNLICAGGGSFTSAEQQQIQALELTHRVRQITFYTDQALADLYASAAAFVFPSFYEGFGIPVLEAFSSGCPCVLSQTSSLPEVAGEAALYIDPSDPQNIAQVVDKLLINSVLKKDLIEKGYQRLQAFSWPRAVGQTLAVYQSILEAHG